MAVGTQFTAANQARQFCSLCWVSAALSSHGPGVGDNYMGAQGSFSVSLSFYSLLGHTRRIWVPQRLQGLHHHYSFFQTGFCPCQDLATLTHTIYPPHLALLLPVSPSFPLDWPANTVVPTHLHPYWNIRPSQYVCSVRLVIVNCFIGCYLYPRHTVGANKMNGVWMGVWIYE